MAAQKLEKSLIEHCAPTLAGIKSANLFNYFFASEKTAEDELWKINEALNGRGVCVEPLLWKSNSVLVYVYRKKHLEQELLQSGVMEFLQKYGYESCEICDCIEHLKERLRICPCFPHEIGVFLGYPLADVIGFIENGGQNCKYCGVWKVYCNESETKRIFEKFKKCTNVYAQVFAKGRSITQMTVCT